MTILSTLGRPALVGISMLLFLGSTPQAQDLAPQLQPTVHPALPEKESDLWLVPSARDRAARTIATYQPLADAAAKYQAGDYAAALQLAIRPELRNTPLADYASYYAALAEQHLGRAAEARRRLEGLLGRNPQGYLAIASALAVGEVAEALGDSAAALRLYEPLAEDKKVVTDTILVRLGRAALATGDRAKAGRAFLRLYYEFPLTDAANAAAPEIAALSDVIERPGYKLDLGRAQQLFGARRYPEARSAFSDLQGLAQGDDKEVVNLRVAECDFYLKHYVAARDGVSPYLEDASRTAEARFFYLSALRELGNRDEYVSQTAALVQAFPDSSWSEEALNNIATFYILANEDENAADTFRQMYEQFPRGQRAERAAWKYGWWKYKIGEYAETIRVFETAAAAFPRSDYRPSYLYWSARAHAKLGHSAQSDSRLRLVYADYGRSYYGRLAERQLAGKAGAAPPDVRLATREQPPVVEITPIPTDNIIRLLLANGLYDDALNELRYAQRQWGDSPRIDATLAWAYNQKGDLRRAITLMRRAYPQHLVGGEQTLPTDILQVIFPLTFWDQIRKQATINGLDPYLVAALVAQESTFDPKVKSGANAWGLMQVLPSTGRRLARSAGMKRYSSAMLLQPDVNLRLGTLYFKRLEQQFGGTYYALASYNAGESRVVRWKAERPGLEEDEFIDDIPFPETQNYVKRILGTAEDYRMLYGEGNGEPLAAASSHGAKASTSKSAAKKPAAKKSTTTTKKTTTKKR